jgi:hypothetical protein
MDQLEDYDCIVSTGPGGWVVTITIAALMAGIAVEMGANMIERYAAKVGMPSWPTVRVEAVRQDILAEELARPSLPDLVSTPEAAEILGVAPQRVHQLVAEREDFPEAAYELRAGKLWLRAAIEAFASRRRMPGRPRKAATAATPLSARISLRTSERRLVGAARPRPGAPCGNGRRARSAAPRGRTRSAPRRRGTGGSSRPGGATRSLLAGRPWWRHPGQVGSGEAGTPPRLVKLCPVPAWDPHGSGDGTRQRGRKRVLSGTDVPRMLPTAAGPRTSQPGQITGFRRRGYVCGAGGARTHDRRIMRTTARRSRRSTCTDTTEPCHRWPSLHCMHGWLGPRTGPRPPQRAPDVNYGASPHTARDPPI